MTVLAVPTLRPLVRSSDTTEAGMKEKNPPLLAGLAADGVGALVEGTPGAVAAAMSKLC